MKMEIESTPEIVAIGGVPCRKWNVRTIDGVAYATDAQIFNRLLLLPKALVIEDPDIMVLNGPSPPGQSDLPFAVPEIDEDPANDDEIDSFSVSA